MPDYSKTLIYKIVCKDVSIKETYGGHTTHLVKRKQQHKSICNNITNKRYNSYIYKFIRDNGGFDNFDVIWQYDFPCNSKREAELEERRFIEKEKCELNSMRPFVTSEEIKKQNVEKTTKYRENNREKVNKYRRQHHQKNKDEVNEKRKKKYTCECGSILRISDKPRHEKTQKHIQYCQQI